MTRAKHLAWFAPLLCASAVACAASDSASGIFGGSSPGSNSDAGSFAGDNTKGPNATAADPGLATDNGVILVHAALGPAFRLCFEHQAEDKPTPSAELMPEANVVGVDVGSAVRIAPLQGAPGKVRLYFEPLIRNIAPSTTCANLDGTGGTLLGTIDANLSHGVHLLVVTGCAAGDPGQYSKAKCGESWVEGQSNLAVSQIELTGGLRTDPGSLPTQVLHLSQGLENARGAKPIHVAFGALASAAADNVSVSGPTLNGPPLAFPANPTFDPNDLQIYGKVGFRVSLGADKPLLEQSLAEIQDRSAPRDLPTTYYSIASNYVLLLLGDPPKNSDAGDAGSADRGGLHFLVVPVISPKADGGVDGGDAG